MYTAGVGGIFDTVNIKGAVVYFTLYRDWSWMGWFYWIRLL